MVGTPRSSARSTASSAIGSLYYTPKKSLYGDEENSCNGTGNTPYNSDNINSAASAAKERFIKRTRLGSTPLRESFARRGQLDWAGHDSDAESEFTSYAASSVAASSVVSVSNMRSWLDDFGKKNKAHYEKVNEVGKQPEGVSLSKPLRSKCGSEQAAAMVVVKNLTKEGSTGPAKTPVRIKPRYGKVDVQATNDGYASVEKLSRWLADDPTSTKKVKHVRKGINVIHKSRMFEKDMAHVIIEENDIRKGSVIEKKRAFQNRQDSDDDEIETGSVNVTDKKMWLENAFPKAPRSRAVDEVSDISALSVSDKKRWLQSAFAREDGRSNGVARQTATPDLKPRLCPHPNGEGTPSVTKQDASELTRRLCSQRKSQGTPSTRAPGHLSPCKLTPRFGRERHRNATDEKRTDTTKNRQDDDGAGRDQPLQKASTSMRLPSRRRQSVPVRVAKSENDATSTAAKEEKEALGFKAARELLIKRSEKNGNAVSVFSKVQRRKQKFERIEKERKKGTGPEGLLKGTWETNDPTEGSTTNYKKSFVEDIAPKKSFEELP